MKNLKYFLVVIFLLPVFLLAQSETVYEDAEDGATNRWYVYDNDPSGATINNIFDSGWNSRVIEVNGSGTDNAYRLSESTAWNYLQNSTQFVFEWSMKYNENYSITVKINTTGGNYYLIYTQASSDGPNSNGIIRLGLGESSKNGSWQTFERDLKDDFENAVPGETISEIQDFIVRGSGRVDDIKLKENSALPVELTTFTATAKENKVSLSWETATEVNNYGFNVERKPENGDWSKAYFIEGHGNSNSPKYYAYVDNAVISGKYIYRLKQIDIDGSFKYSKIVEVDLGVPTEFELSQNYPNPFNPTTKIQYSIPVGDENIRPVQLKIYDVLGNELVTLVNKNQEVGSYEVNFDASNLTSGIYFYTLSTGNFIQTKKMILLR